MSESIHIPVSLNIKESTPAYLIKEYTPAYLIKEYTPAYLYKDYVITS